VKTRNFDQVRQGEQIPAFPLALTLQRLVMESAANRDFAPIHHNREIARAGGAPQPYANTMLVQAMFEATLRQWMGLDGRLRKLAFAAPLGVPTTRDATNEHELRSPSPVFDQWALARVRGMC
jgi:acyl dehydratase